VRRRRAALVAAVAVAALAPLPADGHSGGRAQLYVDSVRFEPATGGWQADLVVRDADSGKPEPGVAVRLTAAASGGSSVGPVQLADPDGDGRFSGLMPVAAGTWTVGIEAEEIPGGPRALPFRRTWPAILAPGQALDLGRPGAAGRSGGRVPAVPLGAGALGAVVLYAGWRRSQRAHSPVTGGCGSG
jgi:hypothetical protein